MGAVAVGAVTTGITIGGVFFDGGATATLATGLAAVIGAIIIGFRQSSISNRQNAILEKQVAAQEASDARQAEMTSLQLKIMDRDTKVALIGVRASLFGERLKFYDAVIAHMNHCVFGELGDSQETAEQEFFDLLKSARFLFPTAVASMIYSKVSVAKDLVELRYALSEREKIGDEITQADRSNLRRKKEQVRGIIPQISGIMKDEMRLYLIEDDEESTFKDRS